MHMDAGTSFVSATTARSDDGRERSGGSTSEGGVGEQAGETRLLEVPMPIGRTGLVPAVGYSASFASQALGGPDSAFAFCVTFLVLGYCDIHER